MNDINHPLIKELLPLYIDNAVSEETKQIVKEHLHTCEDCRIELMELQSGDSVQKLPGTEAAMAAEEEQPTFIKRLKKIGLMVAAAVVATMMVFAAGSWILGHEAAEDEQLEEDQELIRLDQDLISLSPPKQAILDKSGVKIEIVEKNFQPDESVFRYRYTWENPNIDFVNEDIYWPNHLIAMDLTNNRILHRMENKSSVSHSADEVAWTLSGIEQDTEIVGIEMPNLAVFYRPQPFQIDLNEQGETAIDQIITVNGIDFQIHRAEVTDERILVHYEQLDEVSSVGLYELSFSLLDSNGKHWSKEPNVDFQIEKERVSNIPFLQGMTGPFTLELEHAVLIVPGMHYKFSVK